MFAQLGTVIFDGLKSFVSFSDDQEAVIAEHALINRPPRLQGTAVGLRNISISLFLHQEFTDVSNEISKLRKSMTSFEILPLLWGNGQLEGNFVIVSIGRTNIQMDNLGNTVAASIDLALKESIPDDNQNQQTARDDAFATGKKKPPTKSNRVNPKSCNQQISDILSIIKINASRVDAYSRSYTGDPPTNNKMSSHLNIIALNCQKLLDASQDPNSCVYNLNNFDWVFTARDLKNKAYAMAIDVISNNNGIGFTLNISGVKADNEAVQAYVKSLEAALSKVTKSAIVKK